jgi:hypothetical protein
MSGSPRGARRRAALLLFGLLVATAAVFACAPRGGGHSESDLDTPWHQLIEEARMAALQEGCRGSTRRSTWPSWG